MIRLDTRLHLWSHSHQSFVSVTANTVNIYKCTLIVVTAEREKEASKTGRRSGPLWRELHNFVTAELSHSETDHSLVFIEFSLFQQMLNRLVLIAVFCCELWTCFTPQQQQLCVSGRNTTLRLSWHWQTTPRLYISAYHFLPVSSTWSTYK